MHGSAPPVAARRPSRSFSRAVSICSATGDRSVPTVPVAGLAATDEGEAEGIWIWAPAGARAAATTNSKAADLISVLPVPRPGSSSRRDPADIGNSVSAGIPLDSRRSAGNPAEYLQ